MKKILMAAVLCASLTGCAHVGGQAGTEPTLPTEKTQPALESAPERVVPVAVKGDTGTDAGMQFTVHGMACGATKLDNGVFEANSQQGRFCQVKVTVKNVGRESKNIRDWSQAGWSGDVKYDASSEAGVIALQPDEFYANLNPGASATGNVVFDLQEQTKLDKVELHGDPNSPGVTIAVG